MWCFLLSLAKWTLVLVLLASASAIGTFGWPLFCSAMALWLPKFIWRTCKDWSCRYTSAWCCEQNVVWSFNCLFLCTAVWTWFSSQTCSNQFKWTKYNNANNVSLHLLLVYWLVRHLHSYWAFRTQFFMSWCNRNQHMERMEQSWEDMCFPSWCCAGTCIASWHALHLRFARDVHAWWSHCEGLRCVFQIHAFLIATMVYS